MDELVERGELAAYRHAGFWEPMDTLREYRLLEPAVGRAARRHGRSGEHAAALFWRGRRVLVTGHTGFKGSWLCLWLHAAGGEGHRLFRRHLRPTRAISRAQARCSTIAAATFAIRGRDRRRDRETPAGDRLPFRRPVAGAQGLCRPARRPIATNVLGTLARARGGAARAGVRAVVIATTDKVYRNDESGRGLSRGRRARRLRPVQRVQGLRRADGPVVPRKLPSATGGVRSRRSAPAM